MLVKNQKIIIHGKYVDASELSHGSNKDVIVICDYCGKQYTMKYEKYYDRVIKGTVHKCACRACEKNKIAESNLINYGISSTNSLPDVKRKKIESYINTFGVSNPMKDESLKQKCRDSLVSHYGEDLIEIKEKIKKTMVERYGVDHPSKCKTILDARRKTNMEKYGVENTLSVDSIRVEIAETTAKNGTCKSSQEQIHVNDLLKGKLNCAVGRYIVDIIIGNIAVEIDGSGHDLCVQYGITQKIDFETREHKREQFIVQNGYKIIRFLHKRHTKIKDEEYLLAFRMCCNLLENSDIVTYSFDVHSIV